MWVARLRHDVRVPGVYTDGTIALYVYHQREALFVPIARLFDTELLLHEEGRWCGRWSAERWQTGFLCSFFCNKKHESS